MGLLADNPAREGPVEDDRALYIPGDERTYVLLDIAQMPGESLAMACGALIRDLLVGYHETGVTVAGGNSQVRFEGIYRDLVMLVIRYSPVDDTEYLIRSIGFEEHDPRRR
jgi:hypothetical protein